MAEEENDLIEESNDEMENWIYYNNEHKIQETGDMSTFCDVDTDQQFLYMNCNHLMNDTEPATKYGVCDDNRIENEGEAEVQNVAENGSQIETNTQQTQDNVDDGSGHNIVLKETIDENGQLVEEYFCQQCNFSFNSIEDFLNSHPYLEMLNEKPEKVTNQKKEEEEVSTMAENKLWDLVENIEEVENDDEDDNIIELKPDIQHDDSSQEKECETNTFETDKEHYFCYDCEQIFTDLITAETHDCSNPTPTSNDCTESNTTLLVDNENDDNVYSCHLCDKDYTSFRSFTNHQRWHKKSDNPVGHAKTSQSAPVICEICNTIFASEKNLKLHMKMHKKQTVRTIQDALPVGAQEEYNDLNRFFCEICNKSFDQNLLGIHKNMHQNLEEHSCSKCNKKFENLPSYEIHMQMHVDNYRKGKASKTITNNTDAAPSTSAKVFADGGKRKHACQYCGKEFQRPYEKVKHERIHTGEKPYECEVCGKTFRVSYSLTLHLRTHTDIRPYVCPTCNKRFKQQSVYVHHLKTHVVECAYKCDVCGKSFRTSVQLSGHKNIHSKPYNCTECNRPFASLYAVKIHMKTHNKCHKSNKNLKNRCSICGASYARLFALSLHIKEQHGIDVYPEQMLAASGSSHAIKQKKLDTETALLMSENQESVDHQIGFINVNDEEDLESNEVNNEDDGVYVGQVDHEENIQNTLQNNVYIDETEAATQTILNTGEISVDHFPAEEIITDWLTK